VILGIIDGKSMLTVSDMEARRKKLAKLEKKRKSKLSFAFDDEADNDPESETPSAYDSSAKPSRSASILENDDDTTKRKRIKLGKDPSVNTSFLPDREREEQERIANEIKREEWLKRQEEIKAETVEIQFAYYDGLSHLGSVTVKKGEPIFNLIDKAKQSFSSIRDVATEKLLFAKDDIIIPHELSLYYFSAHNVEAKFGPLFEFYDPNAPKKPRNKNDV
jgi:protein FAM50